MEYLRALPMALGVVVMLLVAAVQMVPHRPMGRARRLLRLPGALRRQRRLPTAYGALVTQAQALRAVVSDVAHESFEAALVVKTLGRENEEGARFAEVSNRLRAANVEVGRTRGLF